MAENRFDRILADLKEEMLVESHSEEMGAVLSDCYDGICLVYETALDRLGEAKLGKGAYRALLEQNGIKASLQDFVRLALGGRTPKDDLPN